LTLVQPQIRRADEALFKDPMAILVFGLVANINVRANPHYGWSL
jgi:hypothetical protein